MIIKVMAAGAACVLACAAGAVPSARAATTLVSERFTGATADARFQGYGSACLTGAPAVTALGALDHPLVGCPSTSVGPVPPQGGAPYGYLQLTDAGNDRAGAALFDAPLPSADGLDVTFEQWQYGSTTPSPIRPGMQHADGISFFLTDGSAGLSAPGAFGGSLGYAQKLPDNDPSRPFVPGVDNGYLGIGLDALGNYFGDWERRGDGCATGSPSGTGFYIPAPGENMVTVRGPGNGTTGYCWLAATTSNTTTTGPWPSTLPGSLVGPLQTLPPNVTAQQAQTLLEPSKRTVRVRVSPGPAARVTVDIDFHDGQGMQQVLAFDAPGPVPTTYSFGFAASTGLFTDVHLIRNVVVRSFRPMAELSLRKSIDPTRPAPNAVGEVLHYRFVLTNTGDQPLRTLSVSDPLVSALTCPDVVLAPGASVTCTGRHRLTQADVRRGRVVNTALSSGRRTDTGTEVSSNPSTATFLIKADPPPKPRPAKKKRHRHPRIAEKPPLAAKNCRRGDRSC
ncbi:hypothetical protein ACIBH1_37080 [Nonomuraea sp. NPDC050663]|uniref:DUF7507 domain-containing protein n=1 Tax=Nonomuraea sp. NPDC050663 TaxID=3364370 RepID=UPI0037B6619F